jgi:polar amino acid transport system ATP-binding protein
VERRMKASPDPTSGIGPRRLRWVLGPAASTRASMGATAESPIVQVRDVDKSFGRLRVLDHVTLEIGRGEVIAVIGPSGSGKTTFLRCLNRLESITRGEIRFRGQVMQRKLPGEPTVELGGEALRRLRMDIGIVFQQYNLFPHLSALQNVTLAPVHVRKVSPVEARTGAEALLDKVGLADKADYLPAQLSGGQQQRVAIARALAMEPHLMPAEVLEVLRGLAGEGMTMVVVTHEMGFARSVANRAVLMVGGRIVEEGPPDQLFGAPRSERTRAFLHSVLRA